MIKRVGKRLGKQEWIDAALRTLAEQGIDAVRVERLADALKVTKGSFYWHFQDRTALLEAVLEMWKARRTHDIITFIDARGGDARARLRTLGFTAFNADGRLDQQVRAWAAHDVTALAAQKAIDKRRISYLADLYVELDFSRVDAVARARFIYQALVGSYAMGDRERLKPEQLEMMVELMMQRVASHGPPTRNGD